MFITERADAGARPARVARSQHRPWPWLVLVVALAPAAALANPVPDRAAREMNERPGRWLAHPTPEDERGLIGQFAGYGISRGLLSSATVDLLERNFDRFAPLLVASQLPPHTPQASLQRWYREHADSAQAEAMKRALRQWLTATMTEAPRSEAFQDDACSAILNGRLVAAEALGDWHDREAVPDLRRLLASLRTPRVHVLPEGLLDWEAVLTTAIRRIGDPARAEVLVPGRDGRIEVRRLEELDSLVVTSADLVTGETATWRADSTGADRICSALEQGREFDWRHRPPIVRGESTQPRRLALYFRDGPVATLESSGDMWEYGESGRRTFRLEIADTALAPTIVGELRRAGIAPASPRFVQESVTLFIDPGQLRVTGLYDFEGASRDGWLPLDYPVARGDGLGEPHLESVELRSTVDRTPLSVTYDVSPTGFRLSLTPGKVTGYELEIHYSQALTARRASYLITTAREWGRPLHRGWFQVITDRSLGEPRFSHRFREATTPGEDHRRFYYEASPFRPERDLDVTW